MDERILRVYLFHQPSKATQLTVCLLAIGVVAGVGMILHDWMGYRVVALMLLLAVSMLAIFLDIMPVIVGATYSDFLLRSIV